jgi:hypothetical protein
LKLLKKKKKKNKYRGYAYKCVYQSSRQVRDGTRGWGLGRVIAWLVQLLLSLVTDVIPCDGTPRLWFRGWIGQQLEPLFHASCVNRAVVSLACGDVNRSILIRRFRGLVIGTGFLDCVLKYCYFKLHAIDSFDPSSGH